MMYYFSAHEIVFIYDELHRFSNYIIDKKVMELNTKNKISYTFALNRISNFIKKIEALSSNIFNPIGIPIEITEDEKEILFCALDYSENWHKSVTEKDDNDENFFVLTYAQEIYCCVLKEKITKGY